MPRNRKPTDPIHRPPAKIVLDWKAYFLEFCQVHGEPVEHKGYLLFKDGWRYSMTAYEGPEYPPPDNPNELDILVTTYWLTRKRVVEVMLGKLKFELQNIDRLTKSKSLPLQQMVVAEDDDGKARRGYQKVDVGPLKERIKWLTKDHRECVVRLQEIQKFYEEQEKRNAS